MTRVLALLFLGCVACEQTRPSGFSSLELLDARGNALT